MSLGQGPGPSCFGWADHHPRTTHRRQPHGPSRLAASGLSPKTIQKHVDKLWALGGEIIRNLNETPSLRRKPVEEILDDRIDEEGGPLVYAHESEALQQRSLA